MKIHLIAAAFAVLSLAACNSTTTAANNPGPATGAQAMAADSAGAKMVTANSSCEEIQAQIQALDSQVETASGDETVANVAESAAINGALYSGALGNIPFLGAGIQAVSGVNKARIANNKAKAEKAEDERNRLMGLYEGKGC